MTRTVLVTGGAGFIGCHVVRALLRRGYDVRVLDSLVEQVHGVGARDPVLREVELIEADVRDACALVGALRGCDAVVHLAAEVGVGQSMYAIERYVSANDVGSAVLFQALIEHPVRRVVVASSMSIYGEGLYATRDGTLVETAERNGGRSAVNGRSWEPVGEDGDPLGALPTPEWKRPSLVSVYALTKFMQERLTLTVAPAYGMEAVALRLFNVFGPGQALSNPYTGVLAIFASRLMAGQPPVVFEDGLQRRDFVHVEDVARAFVLALEQPDAAGGVFNVGSGRSHTVLDIARLLGRAMGRSDIVPEIVGKGRVGDIRHCFADIGLAQRRLGYRPQRTLEQSLDELVDWVRRQRVVDRVAQARQELETRGLVA